MRRLVVSCLAAVVAVTATGLVASPASAADAPDRCVNARQIKPSRWAGDTLSDRRDVDWYRFTLRGERRVRAVLGSLPANYKLELYRRCGDRIATSNRSGTQFEEIVRGLGRNTFRLAVRPGSATRFGSAYKVRFQAVRRGVRLLGPVRFYRAGGTLQAAGELLNNTSRWREYVRVDIKYYNNGNVVARDFTYTFLDKVGPFQRQPFHASVSTDRKVQRARLTVTSQPADDRVEGLRVLSLRSFLRDGWLHFTGKVKNPNRFRVDFPQVAATLYSPLGNVVNTKATYPRNRHLAPGERAGYHGRFYDHWRGSQRIHVLAQGT